MHRLLLFIAVAGLLVSCGNTSNHSAPQAVVSTEWHPNDKQWYSEPWPEEAVPRRLDNLPVQAVSRTDAEDLIVLDPEQQYQRILGIGASLEHSTVYAIRKNKTRAEQKALLAALIDPVNGIGLNLFRISIGTSDFSDGTYAETSPDSEKGWYSFQDTPESTFSIQRNIELGITDTLQMAIETGNETHNPVKLVASPWSPPRWMRERNDMVQGGTLKPEFYEAYAQYLREFIEAYAAEGIPVYALTLQNERQFEPPAYPGMVLSWQQERDLLIAVYHNFHNVNQHHGDELNVKLWTLDHNFDYWQQAVTQLDDFLEKGLYHYIDGTAFHHYAGDSSAMASVHQAHPQKDVIFTEGSVWGVGGDNLNRGFQSVIRHFRHWSTAYISWVTMLPQEVDEANQGPYNKPGVVGPTMLIQEKGDSNNWYKTPEYWLTGQFSKFIRRGAVRIGSSPETINHMENVAFQNPDGSVVAIATNPNDTEQTLSFALQDKVWQITVPANSIATVKW